MVHDLALTRNIIPSRLAENIALLDDAIEIERATAAACAALIHQDNMSCPMRYETLAGDMRSTLSGVKQRVLLARALYRQPKVLFMDEGTAHLDAEHERVVDAAIASMGITRIVIAHRRETIEIASRIFVFRRREAPRERTS